MFSNCPLIGYLHLVLKSIIGYGKLVERKAIIENAALWGIYA